MPFVQRVVEPKFVCRRRVNGDVEDELETVVNVALSGTLRQLASLASHADALFSDLRAELEFVKIRTKALRTRMDSLEVKVHSYNPRMVSVRNGVDVNILKISQFEEIAPLLSGLNLGQKIRFKRNFETWGRSATIEIISEAIDPDASVIEINQSHSTCGQKTPQKSPNKTSGYIISSPSSAPSSVYLENILRSPELRSTADKTAVPAESIHSQCASKNLFGKTQGTITCSDSLRLVIQRNALIGQSITHFYHDKGFLDKSSRNKLAKLIISAELSESVHIKIDTSRFLKLAEWIVEIFPTEKREIWFTPFKSIQGKKRVPARGKLVDLYHNICRNLIKAQIISSRRSSSQVQIAVSPTEGGIDEEVQLKIDWLKKTGTPFSTAADYWRKTFSHRRHNFIQHDISIHKYFEDFGLLKTNSGSKLLSLDFDYLYPDHSQNLFSLWPICKEKIFSYFKRKVENNKGLESVANVLGIDLTVEAEGDISEFSQRKEHFVCVEEVTTGLFTPDTRPPPVKKLYEAASLAAAAAAARAAEAVAASVLSVTPLYDSDSIVIASHTLHTTTNTTTFVESSWSSVAASRILARASKRLRNFDIETRTPASQSQLRRWTSTEALGSPTVSLGAQTIEHNRTTMPPDDTMVAPPEEGLADHRLPSPEEQVNAVAMRFQPELVAVDVSGRAFDRMALFRRSLTHVNCPPEEGVRRRAKGKKGRRRKRRNTIAGTGDKELLEALDEPSTSTAPALENSRVSAGESTDIPDAEATSIGMSSTASSAIDKKSHFENIRQWTRSKLRGSMARARSVGRTEDEHNHYEVVRRRDTSLPISTLSGAMTMAVKLRQGATRRAVGGLSEGVGSRSSSGKGPGSGDAAINSSSGNWSGTSSVRASLESEETQIPKVPTPVASLSTAPASTTTSCSAATSSASSTASSSGGSSATNSLGRRDSASTASFTGQSRRRYDSRIGPASSSSSAPHSSSTARAMSTSSEGTLTPDLVTIPFADDGETSSVYSCDTEGYYTSFHMDSGLKTLKEEEAATVAALIANAALGVCNSSIGVNSNNSSAIAENEYELFGKGSTSTTTSSAGTVCTTLMVRDRPAVPPRHSSLDSDLRQPPSRTASSFDLDSVTAQTTITKAVVHAMPDEDGEDVDSGHNTTSSSSASSSPSTSPVEQTPAIDKEVAICSNGGKSESKWGTGWSECEYEFSESDLEGVEHLERIRVKTTINSSRIPSMCVITPPQSDDEGGFGKLPNNPPYNAIPKSPKGREENNLDYCNSTNPANGIKPAESLDNLSKKIGSSINNSSKPQVVKINSSGYATQKNIEGKDGGEEKMKNNSFLKDAKANSPISEKSEAAISSEETKTDQQPPIKISSTKPFNIMGMMKGVLSSAAEVVKSHSKSGGSSNMESTYQSSSQIDYDKDGEYVSIAEVEKERIHPVAPVTTAKMIPGFREVEYVSLNELTPNATANQQPLMQSNASSPASSLERNRRRQGARVTLDAEGRVVYSSDSLTRRWRNGKTPTSTFEPGPHVRSNSPVPNSPLPNRVPKSNIRPVNSSTQHSVIASKPLASPLTSPTQLGRRLIIRPGNQQQPPVVEPVPTKAAVTALPGPVSPKLPHQGAYVNMQTRSEQLHGGSPSPMRSPIAGGSWLQPAHIHPMQKQFSTTSSSQPWPYNISQTSHSDSLNQHPHNILPNHLPNHSQTYWTLPSRRVQPNLKDTVPRSSTPQSREKQSVYSNNMQGLITPISKSNDSKNKFFNSLPPNIVRPPLPYHGNIDRLQNGDQYCFKSPTTNNQPPHRWLVDSNHNVMHSAAPTSSTPTSKYTNSIPRHFEDISPLKSPTTNNDAKNPPKDSKLKDVAHSPLFIPKTTMPSDELFALIHRSKKRMNIRTDLDSPVRSGSPASHSSLSPGSSESSLSGIQPPKYTGTRNSWSPQEGSCNPSSSPIVNGTHSSPGSRLSWAGNSCTVTPPTSRTDFKRLLLQQRHGGGNRVSAAERLKVGKFGGTFSNSPNYSTIPMSVSPRGLNLLPMNSVVTPRNRMNSARRFASPRTDVLSLPIPEDKDEEEIGNETKTKKNTTPTHFQNGSVNNELKNSLCHKATDNSFKGIQKNPDNKSNGGLLSLSKSSISKSQASKSNEQSSILSSNHIAKSILHSPSPTLGALMNKQKRQSPTPNGSLGPSVMSILEAIQVSKAKSPSKVALETAL